MGWSLNLHSGFYLPTRWYLFESLRAFPPYGNENRQQHRMLFSVIPAPKIGICILEIGCGAQALVEFTCSPVATSEPKSLTKPYGAAGNTKEFEAHSCTALLEPVLKQGALRSHILKPQSSERTIALPMSKVQIHIYRKLRIHAHSRDDNTPLVWSNTGV